MNIDATSFLELFKEALEMENNNKLTFQDCFRDIDEWDSLARLSIIAMLDEEYEIELESEDFDRLNTVEDVYFFVKSKR